MRKTKQEGVSKFSPISQYLRANRWTKEADSFDAEYIPQLEADEMRVEALRAVGKSGNEWFWFNLDSLETSDNNYPSRLHATFAAIEAALDKETT